ncbi:MAG: hypothetical protein KAH30_05630 [Caldisericia bacterium]|nr:hypothetical protein [Caldisericia bacterium]
MEWQYLKEKNAVLVKPIGTMRSEGDVENLARQFKDIQDQMTEKFWMVSDITEFFMENSTLLRYFAKLMMSMDKARHGTIFIVRDPLRRTGIKLLKYYRKVEYFDVPTLDSAFKLINKLNKKCRE